MKLCQPGRSGSEHIHRLGWREEIWKGLRCLFFYYCYSGQLDVTGCCLLSKRRTKSNPTLNKGKRRGGLGLFVLQVRVNAASVPAEKFHSGCIILSVGSFSLLLSLVWLGMPLWVIVCVCALPGPEFSARPRMHAQTPLPMFGPASTKTHLNRFGVLSLGEWRRATEKVTVNGRPPASYHTHQPPSCQSPELPSNKR